MRTKKQRQRHRKPYYSDRDYRGQYESNPGNHGPRYSYSDRGLFRSGGYDSWDEFDEEPGHFDEQHTEQYGTSNENAISPFQDPLYKSQLRAEAAYRRNARPGSRYADVRTLPGQRYTDPRRYGNRWFEPRDPSINSQGLQENHNAFHEGSNAVGSGGYSHAGSAETSDWGYGDVWDDVLERQENERDFDSRTPGINTRTDRYGAMDRSYRQQSFGRHRGKGPKGYKRSDERIREDISDFMSEDAMLDASTIEVKVKEGEVTLAGDVLSRRDKRRAEDIAESVLGIGNVENRIRVNTEPSAAKRKE